MLNQKVIKFIDSIEVQIFKLNFKNFLLLKNGIKSYYLLVPTGLFIKKNGQIVTLQYNQKKMNKQLSSDYSFIYSKLINLNVSLEKMYTKKLVLKGLGLKAILLNENLIELKLGFSHSIKLTIPSEIKVTIIKNILILESFNSILLGNFAASIKKCKAPDSYKGKGVCYKNEVLILKAVKKT